MFRRLNQAVRDYFGFSQAEARGFLVLMLLTVLALLAPFVLDLFPTQTPDTSATDQRQLDSLLSGLRIEPAGPQSPPGYAENRFRTRSEAREPTEAPPTKLFAFNPNTISGEQWQQLGLPRWLAERIVRYRNKGGRFRKKEDLRQIYDFPEETYQRLEPYIRLDEVGRASGAPPGGASLDKPSVGPLPSLSTPSGPPTASVAGPKPAAKTPFTFDLNTADTTELKRVYGIGSKLSARIVKKREDLGGFHDLNQLRTDVWGLDSVVVDELLKHARLTNPQLRKLNVNTATFEQLRHPYLKFHVAKAIIAYRQQHGPYNSPNDLLNVKVLDAGTLQKLLPYLEF
jgi:DNA uptake protein ComE-like DNA-binding protein